jgi:hypothetical protein
MSQKKYIRYPKEIVGRAKLAYEKKKAEEKKILENKPPRMDMELIDHIIKVYTTFRDKMYNSFQHSPALDYDMRDRVAGYLTIAYFATGGKLPVDKYYNDIMSMGKIADDLEKEP